MASGSATKRVSPKTGKVSWSPVVRYDDGRQKRLPAQPTKKAARELIDRTLHELRTGGYVEPTATTVAQLVERWLGAQAHRLRPSTVNRYRRSARTHLLPALGAVRLSALGTLAIQELYDRLTAGQGATPGLSASGVRGVHKVLRGALEQAVAWRLLARNPAVGVLLPREAPRPLTVWSAAESAAFLESSGDDPIWGALWRVALLTGMRRGELLALRWADVDVAGAVLVVARTITEDAAGRPVAGPPKTAAGRRAVALSPSSVAAFRRQAARQAERRLALGPAWQGVPGDVVFDQGSGRPIHPDSVRRAFKRAVKRAGVPDIRFHDLRHTMATLALEEDLHPKIVQERLGHKTIRVTLDRYTHVSGELQRAAAERLDAALDAAARTSSPASDPARDHPVTAPEAEGSNVAPLRR